MHHTRRGFTMLEAMVVCALLSVIFLITGGAVMSAMRISAREAAMLQMDQDANRILETLKVTLRPAYIPVSVPPLNAGRKNAVGGTDLEANAARWRSVLDSGSDLVVFLSGIDTEGDGDIIYGDSSETKRLIFGVDPTGDPAAYTEATDKLDTLNNLGIVDLNPISDLGLSASAADVNINDSRFDQAFTYPSSGTRNHVYGVVRFAPMLENGSPIIISESTVGLDLNDDGDMDDSFALGRIELVYPDITSGRNLMRPISGNSVLLQINRTDNPEDAPFQLWQSGSGRAIRVKLLMCNYTGQKNPWAFRQGGNTVFTRSYESVIKMQTMSID